jgi:outer membrane protein OmpA-like peptidoglycan-associated protein
MYFARRLVSLMLMLLLLGVVAPAQTLRSTEDPRNPSPTVMGGTGLFTVYDAQTLRRGEFTMGAFANFYHRDPGDIAFQSYPANFQVGFNDRIEIFGRFDAQSVVTTGSPALLSGFYLPDVRTSGLTVGRVVVVPLPDGSFATTTILSDPCNNGGFAGPCTTPNSPAVGPFVALPTGNDTALYLRLGAPVGGILPAIQPNNAPSYYPNAPFLARGSDSHTGDIWLGGKIRILQGPKSPFGFALIPLFKIPITSDLNTGLERGRSTGAFDYGVIAALDGRLSRHINLATNIGYIKKGDPSAEDMNLGPLCPGCGVIPGFGRSGRALDLPDELRASIGVDFPMSQYLQFIVEVNSTTYVGSRTPSLLNNSPVDLVAGAKIYPTRWFGISGAFQRHMNWFSDIDSGTANGFIFGVSVGRANARAEPVLPNQPPTVVLNVGAVSPGQADVVRDATTVCVGDKVALSATGSDPDGDTLLYQWTSTGGQLTGEGTSSTFDTAGLAPGEYTVTVNVDDGCGCVAFDSKVIRVTNCPPLTVCFNPDINVTADKSEVDAGERIAFATNGVSGGRNFGNVTYTWTATAGTISGSGLSANHDTTGVTGGTPIDVTVRATSDLGACSASGTSRVMVKQAAPPPKPQASEISQCTSFRTNNSRVDNACKDTLRQVIQALQADPQAKLVIIGYRAENEKPENLGGTRAKNARDRLADGGLGAQIDVNRISIRDGGVTADTSQLRIWLVPSGADDPEGGTPIDAGEVSPESRAPRRR